MPMISAPGPVVRPLSRRCAVDRPEWSDNRFCSEVASRPRWPLTDDHIQTTTVSEVVKFARPFRMEFESKENNPDPSSALATNAF